jgi:hypothetical protein
MTTAERHTAQQRLVQAARRRIDTLELNRAIYWASRNQHLTHRQISAVVADISTTSIQRILTRFATDPSLLNETPAEVIDKRAAGVIDDAAMMDTLLGWSYEFGRVEYVDGVATDVYTSRDWDDIEQAYYCDRLTDVEFAQLVERHRGDLKKTDSAREISTTTGDDTQARFVSGGRVASMLPASTTVRAFLWS